MQYGLLTLYMIGNKAFRRMLRREQTNTEVSLWSALRSKRLSAKKFRRQHPIGRYIVDFYCHDARLVIEVDGSSHDDVGTIRHDELRDAWLASHGYKVLRFTNTEIFKQFDRVLWEIEDAVE
jgi:very-short-patch-repair endonuclease